jgi:hypothetical protein
MRSTSAAAQSAEDDLSKINRDLQRKEIWPNAAYHEVHHHTASHLPTKQNVEM